MDVYMDDYREQVFNRAIYVDLYDDFHMSRKWYLQRRNARVSSVIIKTLGTSEYIDCSFVNRFYKYMIEVKL